MAWTLLGALVPGSGLIAAGRRTAGAFVLIVTLFAAAAVAAAVMVGGTEAMLRIGTDPTSFRLLAVVVGLAFLLWAVMVVATHASVRRFANLTGAQRVLSAALVTGVIAVVALPAARAAQDALIGADLVNSLFKDTGTTTVSGSARIRPKADAPNPWAGTPRINVLLIGSDSGPDRTGVRPDTMIVASINTVSGDTVLFSLPRNLERVPFPAGSPAAAQYPDGFYCVNPSNGVNTDCLLNSLWTFGEDHPTWYPGSNPGLAATIQGAEQVTGLKIANYAMLNLRGFEDFVNAIGGVTVNVYERLPIGGSAEHPVASAYIDPGLNQHLDGYRALWFARSRWSTSDFSRMARQRCVIGAVASQANPVTVAQNFAQIAAAAKNNIATDIPLADLSAWVDLTLKVKKAGVRSLAFTDKIISTHNPDFAKIHTLVQDNLTPPAKKAKSSSTPRPSATPTPSSGATPSPSASGSSTVAQDVNEVC